MTRNKVIIWNSSYNVGFQFIFDDGEAEGCTFVHLYPYDEEGGEEWYYLPNETQSKIFIDAVKKLPKVLKEYMKKFGKPEKLVFRPKNRQTATLYSSNSFLNLAKDFVSDYEVEVLKNGYEGLPKGLPNGTVIMKLKK
jgi:hypothetical protein